MSNSGESKVFSLIDETIGKAQETSQSALFERWKDEALAGKVEPFYKLEVYRRKAKDDTDQVLIVLRTERKQEISVDMLLDDVSNFIGQLIDQLFGR